MVTQIMRVALAFTGIIVGAGFASGQEIMQYFVAFQRWGLWGAALAAVVMTAMAFIILQLGSYFQASEHGEVFRRVGHPIFSRILDIGVVVTLFSTGFVMFAGAGANLNQQWGWPVPVGAVLMVVLVLAAGFLDVDRVTTVIGAITPFIIGFITLASVYILVFTEHASVAEMEAAAATVNTTLPNWIVAAVNYVGFNLMVAVSMAIVIGGAMFHPRVAGVGGLCGGLIYSTLLLISAATLFVASPTVASDDLPMLTLINQLHPALGVVMAVVVYGMIFNTALGMFYALGKRLTAHRPERFRVVYAGTVLVGFVLSFIGFQQLVGFVYPILGYIGLLLIAVMTAAWIRGRQRIAQEAKRRRVIEDAVEAGETELARRATDASNLDTQTVRDALNDADHIDDEAVREALGGEAAEREG